MSDRFGRAKRGKVRKHWLAAHGAARQAQVRAKDFFSSNPTIYGKIPGHTLDQNENIIVFLSLENHPLVVPKKHIPDIYSLDNELGAEIMKEAIKIAKAAKQGLRCDGVYVTQANEPAAGQDVFHYHMHIYPRWNDSRQWESDEENRKLTAENIKSVL